MQFGFIPGCGTTNTTFILRQLQEKYLAEKKNLYFLFEDLEKAFDWVPRVVVWWAFRKPDLEEWLVKIVQSMHRNAWSCVRVDGLFSDYFLVQLGF